MYHRTLTAIGTALLTLGVASGCAGLAIDTHEYVTAGILVSVPAATVLVVNSMSRHTAVADAQLTDAHRAGYTLALEHVARGLLTAPATPHPGPGAPCPTDNVVPLRPTAPPEEEAL